MSTGLHGRTCDSSPSIASALDVFWTFLPDLLSATGASLPPSGLKPRGRRIHSAAALFLATLVTAPIKS